MEKNCIDKLICTNCHKCVLECFMHAIVIEENKKPYILEDKCIACGACVKMCDVGAIKTYICQT